MASPSTIDQLPEPIRLAVMEAIKRQVKIDDIVDLIRSMGGEASRSAVGRYSKNFRALAEQQRSIRSVAEAFGHEFGDADDRQGRMMVQLMTTLATRSLMPMVTAEDDEEGGLSPLELSRIAKAVKDTMGAAKLDVEREAKIRDEATKRAKAEAATAGVEAARSSGASAETLDLIRKRILGID